MADFNVNVPGVQSGAPTQTRPVTDNSTASAISSIGNLASGFLDSFSQTRAEYTKKLQGQQIGAAETDLSTRLTALQDAREQGTLSESQSRMRARAIYNQAITNNPLIRDKLSDTYNSIINTKGLGDDIAGQTQQEQLQTDQWKKALDAGFGRLGDTPDEQLASINNHQKYLATQAQLDLAGKELSYATAKVGLTNANLETISKRQSIATGAINQQNARLTLATNQAEFQVRSGVGQMAQILGTKSQGDVDDVMKQLQSGKIDKQTALTKIDQLSAEQQQTAITQLGGFGSQFANSVAAPGQSRFENAKKLISGEIDKTVYDNNNHNVIAREQFNAMTTNPSLVQYAAGSDLFKNSPVIAAQFANSGAAQYLSQKSTPNAPASSVTSTDPDHKQSVKSALGVIQSGMSKVNSGVIPKGSNIPDEIPTQLNNYFRDVQASALQENSPSDYNDVVGFMASSDFGNYMKNHGNALTDPKAMEGAASVMEREYSQHAVDTVFKEFLSKNTAMDAPSGGPFGGVSLDRSGEVSNDKRNQAITATYAAGGVTFSALNPSDKAAVRSAQDLNRQAAPVLNNVVRISAHLKGSTDYKQEWNARWADRFDLDKNAQGQSTPQLKDVANSGQ